LDASRKSESSTVSLIQGPRIDALVDQILPKVTGADDEAVLQPIMLEPDYSAGSGPITTDSAVEDEARPQTVVVQPEHFASEAHRPESTGIQRNGSGGSSWLIIVGPRVAPRFRLFCFPFPGGGSAVYRNWAQFIDPRIELCASEPPGHLGRITERPIADMNDCVGPLLSELGQRM